MTKSEFIEKAKAELKKIDENISDYPIGKRFDIAIGIVYAAGLIDGVGLSEIELEPLFDTLFVEKELSGVYNCEKIYKE